MKIFFCEKFVNKLKNEKDMHFSLKDKKVEYLERYLVDKKDMKQNDIENIREYMCYKIMFDACYAIFEKFKQNNIPYIVFKGPVLSKKIFGQEVWRNYNDIDVLIRNIDMTQIQEIIENEGFKAGYLRGGTIVPYKREKEILILANMHQLIPYIKISNILKTKIEIDLNTRILWNAEDKFTNLCFQNVEEDVIFGKTVTIMKQEYDFIALCLHHYKEMNSVYKLLKEGFKLSQICDVFFYIKNRCLNIEKIVEIATFCNVMPYVFYCVYQCTKIFKDPELNIFLNYLYTDEGVNLVSGFGLLVRHNWNIDIYDRIFSRNLHYEIVPLLTNEEKRNITIMNAIWGEKSNG